MASAESTRAEVSAALSQQGEVLTCAHLSFASKADRDRFATNIEPMVRHVAQHQRTILAYELLDMVDGPGSSVDGGDGDGDDASGKVHCMLLEHHKDAHSHTVHRSSELFKSLVSEGGMRKGLGSKMTLADCHYTTTGEGCGFSRRAFTRPISSSSEAHTPIGAAPSTTGGAAAGSGTPLVEDVGDEGGGVGDAETSVRKATTQEVWLFVEIEVPTKDDHVKLRRNWQPLIDWVRDHEPETLVYCVMDDQRNNHEEGAAGPFITMIAEHYTTDAALVDVHDKSDAFRRVAVEGGLAEGLSGMKVVSKRKYVTSGLGFVYRYDDI